MRYKVFKADVEWSDNRWKYKGGRGMAPKRRNGYVGLFDRNTTRFVWFKIIEKLETDWGWLCERFEPVPTYWATTMAKRVQVGGGTQHEQVYAQG